MADSDIGSQNAGLHTSGEVDKYNPSSADYNFVTSRPNYAAGQKVALRPRALYFPVAGAIALVFPGQSAQTYTVTAGALLPYAPVSSEASGSTVTECHVIY